MQDDRSISWPKHELPKLLYEYSALEPYIDSKTMEIHHSKHHQSYINKLNSALEKHPELFTKRIEELLSNTGLIPEDIRTAVIDNGGGHYNHSVFWLVMAPKIEYQPTGSLERAIKRDFGSLDDFKTKFSETALNKFGSGWVWLVTDKSGSLKIMDTSNQASPISMGLTPLLAIDLWEHAYYLKYQNRRNEYIEAWWNVVNWAGVEIRYSE